MEIGSKLGSWIVVSGPINTYNTVTGKDYHKPYWIVKCNCGTERNLFKYELTKLNAGETSSKFKLECKTCLLNKKKEENRSSIEVMIITSYTSYKFHAKKRGYSWDLTREDFLKIATMDCYYCGNPPMNKIHRSELKVQGVDRINNTKGYSRENVVPCCKCCNIAKATLTEAEYLAMAERIVNYKVQRPSKSSIQDGFEN